MSYARSQSMSPGVALFLRTWGPFPPVYNTKAFLGALPLCCAKDRWHVPALLLAFQHAGNRNCTLHLCNSFQWWSQPAKKHWSSLICIVGVVLQKLKFLLNDLQNGQTIILFSSGAQVRCELAVKRDVSLSAICALEITVWILAFKER